jgi:hypothetical protein
MEKSDRTVIIQGIDLLDIISFIGKKNKKFQASMLQDMENVLGKDSIEFSQVRHIVLDGLNEYTRLVLRAIFGNNFEGIIDNVSGTNRESKG